MNFSAKKPKFGSDQIASTLFKDKTPCIQAWVNSGQAGSTDHLEPLAAPGVKLVRSCTDFSQHERIKKLDIHHKCAQTTETPHYWRASEGNLYISTKVSSRRHTEPANAVPWVLATRNAPMDAVRTTASLTDTINYPMRLTHARNAETVAVKVKKSLADPRPRVTLTYAARPTDHVEDALSMKHRDNIPVGVTGGRSAHKDATIVLPSTSNLKVPRPAHNLKVPQTRRGPLKKTNELMKSDLPKGKGYMTRKRHSLNTIMSHADASAPTVVRILTILQPTETKMGNISRRKYELYKAVMMPATSLTKPAANKTRLTGGKRKFYGSLEFPVYRGTTSGGTD